jgi:signal transduction histidine kinase
MVKLKNKLVLFNLLSKLVVSSIFLILLPYFVERINLRQIDNDLISKREHVINLIVSIGIDPFISSDSTDAFGSYNILKEEFISLERVGDIDPANYIDVQQRLIENDEIEYRVLHYSIIIDDLHYLLEVGRSTESILKSKENIVKIIILFIALIIIVTLIADLNYTGLLLRPLDKITDKLKRLTDPALFDKVPVTTSTSDFRRLDTALTQLMVQIDELFKKEKEVTVNISHELMTPISIIRSKLENLLLCKDISPDVAGKIGESLKTLHRLQSLVNSMLLIARIESRQYLREESFHLSEVLEEIIAEVLPVAEDKGVVISQDLSEDYRFGSANRSLLFSMFYNVIYNAIKNTPGRGRIYLSADRSEGSYVLRISDTGIGLSTSQIGALFLRFKGKVDNGTEGNGIGLAITKAIADLHKIDIRVTSEKESGTVFLFIFPENS